MKLGDVDLNNIKVSIFDFDETLAIHKDKNFTKHRSESEESFTNWYYNAYKNPNKFYDEIEPCTKSEILYNYINNLKNMGYEIRYERPFKEKLKIAFASFCGILLVIFIGFILWHIPFIKNYFINLFFCLFI